MTPEEIVKRLRAIVIIDEVRSDNPLCNEAADLIERQAKALSECQRHRAELFDQLHGTPCEQIRHAQEVEELKKALDMAATWIIHKDYPEHLILDTIRAARGKKEND